MNADPLIIALLANLGDPHKLAKRADKIEVPQISKRSLELFKKKFVLLGQAVGAQRIVNFLQRYKDSLDAEKAATQKQNAQDGASGGGEGGGGGEGASMKLAAGKEAPDNALSESQYHGPSGFHVRSQCAYPGSINPSMSFGGHFDVNGKRSKKKPTRKRATESSTESSNEGLESRLNARFDTLGEDFGMGAGSGDATIEADKGRFVVDGQVVMSNGADILKALAMWLIDNEPGIMQRASEELGNMVRKGELFRT